MSASGGERKSASGQRRQRERTSASGQRMSDDRPAALDGGAFARATREASRRGADGNRGDLGDARSGGLHQMRRAAIEEPGVFPSRTGLRVQNDVFCSNLASGQDDI
jgi:hypothetical protein